jgi:transposase
VPNTNYLMSSHYVVTGPLRWPWVRLSLFEEHSPEPQAEEPVMREKLRFLGLDVHAETIAVAVAEPNGEVRSLGTIANREDSIRKFIRKLGEPEQLHACYEAGPTGFVLYWQLTQLGVDCAVVAPSLVPKKPGDRVKTDRRDALKLARSHRSGDLTAVWVPDEASEALRDLVRQREAAKQDQLRARHRLTKFLLRTGQRPPLGLKAWTERYMRWLTQVRYMQPAQEATRLDCMNEVEHMSQRIKRLEEAILEVVKQAPQAMQGLIRGLQALRGVAHISAVTIAAELGNISSRFESARKLMGYSGVFPSEDSSGNRIRRGGITKAGNAHLRRIVVESAWCYRHLPRVGEKLRKRHAGVPAEIIEIAWKAQNRLYKRYRKLTMAGKDQRKVMTAIARELLGFIWAIGIKTEQACRQPIAA